jgi:hypothetical protein
MHFKCTTRSDEGDTAGTQMRAEFPDFDEKLFFYLCRVEFVRERVAAKVVQRVAKP